MDTIPLSLLFGLLAFLIILSGCFSGSETALMSLNRYRLKNKADKGHRGARNALRLLRKPDRLIGLILLGNNIVNVAASMLTTIIVLRLYPDQSGMLAIAGGLLTLVILVFAEVAPKTLAASKPETLAYPAAIIYWPLLKLVFPLVWITNQAANTVLKLVGARESNENHDQLNLEELETALNEAGDLIPDQHQSMLKNIIGLENITVEDIMIPRNDIIGIDFAEDIAEIIDQLSNNNKTRVPVFNESIDNVIGVLHIKKLVNDLIDEDLTKDHIQEHLLQPLFVPENTPLMRQLIDFQAAQRRIALVVDEYGDIQGLVTLEDILEEIVGEFTTQTSRLNKNIIAETDDTYLIDGSIHIRELNRSLNLSLNVNGPKTLSGFIIEFMEMIPEAGTSTRIDDHVFEIVKTTNNKIKTLRYYQAEPTLPVDTQTASE